MHTFEITIQRKAGDGWPVVVEQSKPGTFLPIRTEGTFQLTEEQQTELISLAHDPLAYGTLLGQALFTPQIHTAFSQARTVSQIEEANSDRLRVLLMIEDELLKAWHWERLAAPTDDGHWDFLALDQQAPFSIYLPSLTDRRFQPIGRRDLRALLLVANPHNLAAYNLHDFDAATTVTSLKTALADIPCDVLATLTEAAGPPTLNTLCEQITAAHYTLLHIVAHGQFLNDKGETVLYLADEHNNVAPVTATQLITRLRRLQGAQGLPHFAFLSTCHSAAPQAENGLGGLAQRLVRELGMPAVLAMTEKVSITTAAALAAAFYVRLRAHGELDLALVEAGAGLAERPDITVPALYSRLGGRPLFSGERPLTDEDIEYALARIDKDLPPRAPILTKKFTPLANTLKDRLNTDRSALSLAARHEWDQALAEVNTLSEEVFDLNFRAIALDEKLPEYNNTCPFLGMAAFQFKDQQLFFGREILLAELLERLEQDDFLVLLGRSGCGKSSLVLAGAMPILQKRRANLHWTSVTPGDNPLLYLENALQKLKVDHPASDLALPVPSTLLVIDQFEELFTLSAQDKRQPFVDRLLTLPKQMQLIVTMRADFLGDCTAYPALAHMMETHQKLIGPMDTAELRSAMEQQARIVGLRFEADLSNTILDAVKDEPGAMPLLQHTLLELWQRRHGRWLRAEEYRNIGGVQQAIAQTAEKIYRGSLPQEQTRIRDIFVRLTRLDDEEAIQAEERRDTRQRVRFEQLVPAGSDPDLTRRLVQRLANPGARLLVTSVNETTAQEEVEVSHEALIRYWPRLRHWLDEDRVLLHVRSNLGREAKAWTESNPDDISQRDEDLLKLRGSLLKEAVTLTKLPRFSLSELEQDYLEACVTLQARVAEAEKQRQQEKIEAAQKLAAEQKRRAEVVRRYLGGVLVLLLLAVGAALWAIIAQMNTLSALDKAEAAVSAEATALHESEKNRLEAEAAAAAEVKARQESEKNRLEAEAAAAAETKARQESEKNRLEAEAAAAAATLARQEAERQRHMSLARQLATQSLDILNTKPELGLLLAREAVNAMTAAPSIIPEVDNALRQTLAVAPLVTLRHESSTGTRPSSPKIIFNADSTRLATSGYYDRSPARLVDTASGEDITLFNDEANATNIAFNPAGTKLAIVISDTVHLFDAMHGQKLGLLPHQDLVTEIIFSPDTQDSILATVTDGGKTIYLWDSAKQQQLAMLKHNSALTDFSFNPSATRLTSITSDDAVYLWDVASGHKVASPQYKERYISAEFNTKGSHLLVMTAPKSFGNLRDAYKDGQLQLINSLDGELLGDYRYERNNPYFFIGFRLSPDGSRLAMVISDTVQLVDSATGRTITAITPSGLVSNIEFNPNGPTTHFAIATDSGEVQLRDAVTGAKIAALPEEYGPDIIRFSPDGTLLAAVGTDGVIRIRNSATGENLVSLPHDNKVRNVIFNAASSHLAITGSLNDGTPYFVSLWNIATAKALLKEFPAGGGSWFSHIRFSPDGNRLVFIDAIGKIYLWNTVTNNYVDTLIQSDNNIGTLHFSPDGTRLATGSAEGQVHLWTNHGGLEPAALELGETVLGVVSAGDDLRLASRGADKKIGLHDFESGTELYAAGLADGLRGAWPNFDASRIVASDELDRVYLIDTTTGDRLHYADTEYGLRPRLQHGDSPVQFSPDKAYLAIVDWYYSNIYLLHSKTGVRVAKLTEGGSDPGAKFSPDGKLLVTFGMGTANLWQSNNGKQLATFKHSSTVNEADFSPNGKQLATAASDGSVRLWDVNGEAQDVFLQPESVTDVEFSPTATQLATISTDKTVRLWNLITGQQLLLQHQSNVLFLVFSPDGSRLATYNDAGEIRLWDSGTGAELSILPHGNLFPHALKFSADGSRLITIGHDGVIRRWHLNLAKLVQIACRSTNRNLTQTEWNSHLGDNPYQRTCPHLPADESAIETLFKQAQFAEETSSAAIVRFKEMLDLDQMDEDLATDTKLIAAQVLLAEGWLQARAGNIAEVSILAAAVLQFDPQQDIEPLLNFARQGAANLLRQQAEQLAREGQVEEAVELFGQALELDPTLELDPRREAEAIAAEAKATALFETGLELVKAGNIEAAIVNFTQALIIRPYLTFSIGRYGPQYGDGPCSFSINMDKCLAPELEPEIKAKKLVAAEVGNQGCALAAIGQIEPAATLFRQTLNLNPDLDFDPTAAAELCKYEAIRDLLREGQQLARANVYQPALEIFSQIIDLNPDHAAAHYERGKIRYQQGVSPEALADFTSAIELNYDPLELAYYNRGNVFVGQARYEQALADYIEAATLSPENPTFHDHVCWYGTLLGQPDQVMPHCEKAITLTPDEDYYYDGRGLARALNGNVAGALEDFRRVVESGTQTDLNLNLDWRQDWIRRLEAGEDPSAIFDAEMLRQLLGG